MTKLLSPSSGITWKNYRNETPTFELTPVEKADLSPFLIHMTGKNSLVKILKGESRPESIEFPEGHGYLRAEIPSFDGRSACYNSSVVCFTESPIFTLDFFRYRSYNRWYSDQQYGIGFSKTFLVKHHNVRPVLYLDTNTNGQLLNFCNQIINEKYAVTNEEGEILTFKNLFSNIKNLLFPLLEETSYQGFMWEREWRYPNSQGLVFPHKSIKVICCPQNEKAEILDVLGDNLSNIEVVENWREYDDITNYLKRRQRETHEVETNRISEIKDFELLHELKKQNERTLNTIKQYYSTFKETVSSLEGQNIHEIITNMENKTSEINSQIKQLSDQ